MKYFFLLVLLPFASQAARQCQVDPLAYYIQESNTPTDDYIRVNANNAKIGPKWANLSGDIIAQRGKEVFYAKRADYNRQEKILKSKNKIIYGSPDLSLISKNSNYSLKNTKGNFANIEYYIKKQQANGQAETLEIDRKTQIEKLTNATYTTCNRLNPNWFLKAKKLHLNHNTDTGIARNLSFHIGNIPIMYFPYFTFPLSNKRKTGFLNPKVISSSSKGIELVTPFYVNIASNQDLTIYPRLMGKRGLMLGAEYRYLLPDVNGRISGDYLHKDQKTKNKRWIFKTEHKYKPNDRLTVDMLLQRVSDKNYLYDLKNTLNFYNTNFLPSYLKLRYNVDPNYTITAGIKYYQIANSAYFEEKKPYDVMPSISGIGNWSLGNNINLFSETETVNFNKTHKISGIRINEKLSLGYDFENSFSFIKPKATYRFSYYNLYNKKNEIPKGISRSIPTFSLDTGLYFDRQTTWFGRKVTQLLEPRLYYLYTPYVNQSNIPNFDTALIDSSYDSMFADNRFNGKDRIGDANQVTTAVSTSYIDNDTGKELAKFSVGQVQYFKDRHVSLNNSIANASRSNVIIEAQAELFNNIKFHGLIHRDIDTNNTKKSLFGFTYNKDIDKSVSLFHLYDKYNYKQVNLSGAWRFSDTWRAFWHWRYSIEYKKSVDTIAGLEYADCCWAVRLLARQERNSPISMKKPNNSIYLEFVFKGLGKIGNEVDSLLQRIIPNYQPISY